jgi:ATP-dependent RNA helicase DDX60
MMNFLKLSPSTDVDMIDTIGGGDAHEEEVNADLADFSHETTEPGPSSQNSALTSLAPKRMSNITKNKKVVSDSWEDAMSDEDNSTDCTEAALHDQSIGKIGRLADAVHKNETLVNSNGEEASIMKVLKAFSLLRGEFDEKFKVMWA